MSWNNPPSDEEIAEASEIASRLSSDNITAQNDNRIAQNDRDDNDDTPELFGSILKNREKLHLHSVRATAVELAADILSRGNEPAPPDRIIFYASRIEDYILNGSPSRERWE